MKNLLLYCLLLWLASCAASRPLASSPPVERPRLVVQVPPVGVDSLPTRPPALPGTPAKPTLLRRLFPARVVATSPLPGKCKNCQIVVQSGTGNTSTQAAPAKNAQTTQGDGATSIGKAKAPVATVGSTAQDYTRQAQRGGVAASGAAARAQATPAAGWPWWLWLLLVAGIGYAFYRIKNQFFT